MESWRKPAVAVSMSTRTAAPAGPDGVIGVDVDDDCEEQARLAKQQTGDEDSERCAQARDV